MSQPPPAGFGFPPGMVPPPLGLPGLPYSRPPLGPFQSFPGMPIPLGPPPGMLHRPPPGFVRLPPQLRPLSGSSPVVLPKPEAAGSGPAQASAPKKTDIYVGKIAPSVNDAVVRALLEACGAVKSWKRMMDPETDKPKGFGFCEFVDAEGVLRAQRLLNNLALDGQELLVKCNTATQTYVDQYQRRKEEQVSQAQAADTVQHGETTPDDDAARDNQVLEKIMAIVSERASKGASNAAHDFLVATLRQERPARDGDARNSRGRDKEERELEREFEKARERDRKEEEARAREAERVYAQKVREWERYEREKQKDAEKEAEATRTADKERARLLRADLEAEDSEDDLEPWRRRPYHTSHRADERHRKRRREDEDDAADREAEAERIAVRNLQALEKRSLIPSSSTHAVDAGAADNGDIWEREAPTQQMMKREPDVDPSDPIYQAMMAAAKAPQSSQAPLPALVAAQLQRSPAHVAAGPSPARVAPAVRSAPGKRKAGLVSVFGEDEDDKPRTLKTLQYTEEELRAMREAEQAEQVGTVREAQDPTQDAVVVRKRIADSLPVTMDAVWAYNIDWAAYDAGKARLVPGISAWVGKKIGEMLGMEEPSLVNFVLEKLGEHLGPSAMLEEVSAVLDDEAELFCFKLYRVVIFETAKQAAGVL